MWNALRLLLAIFLFARLCVGQISYRVVRTGYQDSLYGNSPESADYGATEKPASTASNTGHYEYDFGQEVAVPEKPEVDLFTCILIVTISISPPKSAKSRLQQGDVFSKTTRIAIVVTIFDNIEGPTDYATTIGVSPNGDAIVRLDLNSFSYINPDSTGLCASCSLTVAAGACLSGDCGDYDMAAANKNLEVQSAVCGDPYTYGLLGHKMDWFGEDGGWYCLVSDGDCFQLNVRVTAPMLEEFPDKQFVTGVRLLLMNGHSLGMEVNNVNTGETDGCGADNISPCLANGGLRILVDDEEISYLQISTERNVHVSATNLPGECHRLGEDLIWAAPIETKRSPRRSFHAVPSTLDQWNVEANTLAAPTWCAKYLKDDVADPLTTKSNHTTFRIRTPTLDLRINIGIIRQDSVIADDGSAMARPELEFWRTDIGVEWHMFSNTVGGMLGDTARFFLDNDGMPMAEGHDAIGGPVESFRVADAPGVEFEQLHNK